MVRDKDMTVAVQYEFFLLYSMVIVCEDDMLYFLLNYLYIV
jgi:hypothetical protein